MRLAAYLPLLMAVCGEAPTVYGVVVGKEPVAHETHVQAYNDATPVRAGQVLRTRLLECFYALEVGDTVQGISQGAAWLPQIGPVLWDCKK